MAPSQELVKLAAEFSEKYGQLTKEAALEDGTYRRLRKTRDPDKFTSRFLALSSEDRREYGKRTQALNDAKIRARVRNMLDNPKSLREDLMIRLLDKGKLDPDVAAKRYKNLSPDARFEVRRAQTAKGYKSLSRELDATLDRLRSEIADYKHPTFRAQAPKKLYKEPPMKPPSKFPKKLLIPGAILGVGALGAAAYGIHKHRAKESEKTAAPGGKVSEVASALRDVAANLKNTHIGGAASKETPRGVLGVLQKTFRPEALVPAAALTMMSAGVVGIMSVLPKMMQSATLSVTERPNYNAMLAAHPDLKVLATKQPVLIRALFKTVRHLNPEMSKDPVTSGAIVRTLHNQMSVYQDKSTSTGPHLELDTLTKLHRGSDTKGPDTGSALSYAKMMMSHDAPWNG